MFCVVNFIPFVHIQVEKYKYALNKYCLYGAVIEKQYLWKVFEEQTWAEDLQFVNRSAGKWLKYFETKFLHETSNCICTFLFTPVHNVIELFKEPGGILAQDKPRLDTCDRWFIRRLCIKNCPSSVGDITACARDYFWKPLSSVTVNSCIHK